MDDQRPTGRVATPVTDLTTEQLEALLAARRQVAEHQPVVEAAELDNTRVVGSMVTTADEPVPETQPAAVFYNEQDLDLSLPEITESADQPYVQAEVTKADLQPQPHQPLDDADEDDVPTISERPVRFSRTVPYAPEFSEAREDRNTVLRSAAGMASLSMNLDIAAPLVNKGLEGVEVDRGTGERHYVSAEQEIYSESLSESTATHAPLYSNGAAAQLHAMTREDVTWDQKLILEDGGLLPMVRDHSSQESSIASKINRYRSGGRPITIFLPVTNLYLSFTAPHERDMCDFDIEFAQQTAAIGASSFGLLMSASSGVYLRAQVEFALRFVSAANIDCGGNDLKTVLLNTIDIADYWLVIIGMLIAKYPQGLPWRIQCPDSECNHEEHTTLNLARCIRPGNGLFTSAQLAQISRQRGKMVTAIDLADYREARAIPESHVFTHNDGTSTISVEWTSCTLGEYFDYVDTWIEQNNALATAALSEHATERQREMFLRTAAETHRLLRHMHNVKAVTFIDPDGVADRTENKTEIHRILSDMSADRQFVMAFENALSLFIEDSRMVVFGYMAKPCPACKKPAGEKDGTYRGLVSLSPDRVFFTVSRVVSEIQRVLAAQFGGIG